MLESIYHHMEKSTQKFYSPQKLNKFGIHAQFLDDWVGSKIHEGLQEVFKNERM